MTVRPLLTAAAAAGLAALSLAACSGGPSAAPDPTAGSRGSMAGDSEVPRQEAGEAILNVLVGAMTGSFSSAAQAEADSSYFDIRLEMVPIWADRTDAHWLYVEQAAASALDRPYRQRVYRVTAEGGRTFRSEVYSLPEPLRFAGAWKEEAPLAGLTPDSLEVREGCAVILTATESGFTGSTVDAECTSSLRGASYATSEVTVLADRIESWDRGFDAAGAQVWGAVNGPYIFLKTSRQP